ncbi:AAA family ATPase [Escherichia coli]|nr:ATPase [Salmonella enterica subsp. enterica serovar Java]EFG2885710.1 AAA family ATPase [Escherichia coli]MIL09376.1 ATPase [Salmonella enterica subsp. enterica serovar Enteritidis]
MSNVGTDFFVFTGGPGAGKTSVVNALAKRGEAVTTEAGRAVIARHAAAGLPPPYADPAAFAGLMLEADIAEYERAMALTGRVFFDRGVPDLLGYLKLMGLPAAERFRQAALDYRYAPKVFVFPPWRAIYVQDRERHQDFAEAARTWEMMVCAYDSLGYELVEIPQASVEARVEFILAAIGA